MRRGNKAGIGGPVGAADVLEKAALFAPDDHWSLNALQLFDLNFNGNFFNFFNHGVLLDTCKRSGKVACERAPCNTLFDPV
jgi:hypothetical protein